MVLWENEAKKDFKEYESELKLRKKLTKEIRIEHQKLYRQCEDEYSADLYALSKLKKTVSNAFEQIF